MKSVQSIYMYLPTIKTPQTLFTSYLTTRGGGGANPGVELKTKQKFCNVKQKYSTLQCSLFRFVLFFLLFCTLFVFLFGCCCCWFFSIVGGGGGAVSESVVPVTAIKTRWWCPSNKFTSGVTKKQVYFRSQNKSHVNCTGTFCRGKTPKILAPNRSV